MSPLNRDRIITLAAVAFIMALGCAAIVGVCCLFGYHGPSAVPTHSK